MHRRAVTIAEVASAAGVSKMTVSNVLSTKPDSQRHVSEQTRQRVLDTVHAMRYRPNAGAISLRRRRTNVIGLYAGYSYLNAENAFLATLMGGMQEGCETHHKDLLIHGIFRNQAPHEIYAALVDGRIDGLVLLAPPDDPLAELLANSHLPVVAVADAVPLLPSVVVDDAQGTRQSVEYLAGKGHRRLIYHSCTRPFVSAIRRRDACLAIAGTYGLHVTDRPTPSAGNGLHLSEEAAEWLQWPARERPTAALCWNDLTAYDLLEQCNRRDIAVPNEVAIVGFDGVFPTRGAHRRLTTVRAPWADVARTAIDLLVRQIDGETIAGETILPVEFQIGDTA